MVDHQLLTVDYFPATWYFMNLEQDKGKEQKTKKKITDTLIYLKSKPENSPMRNLQALIVVGGE